MGIGEKERGGKRGKEREKGKSAGEGKKCVEREKMRWEGKKR